MILHMTKSWWDYFEKYAGENDYFICHNKNKMPVTDEYFEHIHIILKICIYLGSKQKGKTRNHPHVALSWSTIVTKHAQNERLMVELSVMSLPHGSFMDWPVAAENKRIGFRRSGPHQNTRSWHDFI